MGMISRFLPEYFMKIIGNSGFYNSYCDYFEKCCKNFMILLLSKTIFSFNFNAKHL